MTETNDFLTPEQREQIMTSIDRARRARTLGYPGDSPDEYREGRPMPPVTYTRVYLDGGEHAHLVAASFDWPLCRLGAYECCVNDDCCCSLRLPADAPYEMVNRALDSQACACPHEISLDRWLGSGSQDEIDTAARLPLCTACFAARERQLPDPRLGTGHEREMT